MTTANAFQLFGSPHLAALASIAAVALLLPMAVRSRAPHAASAVGAALAVALLAQEAAHVAFVLATQGPSVQLLPLHLCTLAVYLSAWMLVTRSPRVYEIVYFWGLGGTTQALATPDLARGFPAPEFLLFFAGHGLVIVGIVYGALVYRLRPSPASILRVALITLALATGILAVNVVLGTNFLYLMQKPAEASLMDWLGPWPWYWLPLIGLALLSFLILYAPYFIADTVRSRRHRHPRGGD
ncbi:MAG: TIGR02206 family membrane protein [Thiohalocapsa sp.]|nr:TIGR02206 family membrane protein [Thiohalocapsa sp.]MCF7989254.1 TIGR02206 family membrane protein [Thiohalocapsa sp.]